MIDFFFIYKVVPPVGSTTAEPRKAQHSKTGSANDVHEPGVFCSKCGYRAGSLHELCQSCKLGVLIGNKIVDYDASEAGDDEDRGSGDIEVIVIDD